MNRIKYIKLGDKSYPLTFSMNLAINMLSWCGGKKNLEKAIASLKDEVIDENSTKIIFKIIQGMMIEGCKYLDRFGTKELEPKNIALDSNGKHIYLSIEDIKLLVDSVETMEYLAKTLDSCTKTSQTKTIYAKKKKAKR